MKRYYFWNNVRKEMAEYNEKHCRASLSWFQFRRLKKKGNLDMGYGMWHC